MISSIKVVIADDVEPILLYLEKIISDVPEFEVVGKAKNGNELVEIVVRAQPQMVITDVEMPECSGVEAIEKLSHQGIKAKYCILTSNTSYLLTDKEKQLGILKVIKKPILDEEKLIRQIKEVAMSEQKTEIKQEKRATSVELRLCQNKKENIIMRIINKFFKSK
ncbi:MAG: response regulator transcription factor [Clostridia bacterium]|nr:response regulator transcription factor [Clostridia bacterium]